MFSGYPPEREIDYNNGPYKGIESTMRQRRGRGKKNIRL